MYKIAICDNQVESVNAVKDAVIRFGIEHDVDITLIPFLTSTDLLSANCSYDVLFLDLTLENGKDGISVAHEIRKKGGGAVIVILSYSNNRYRDGYKIGAHRFLDKPLSYTEFNEALISAYANIKKSPDKIFFQFKQEKKFFILDDVIFIESYQRKRYVHTVHEEFITLESLESILSRLPSKQFFCPQKSFIVNLSHVTNATHTNITLSNNKFIHFSKNGFAIFNERIQHYANFSMDDI